MKNSPNREQQLFLVTGGIILILILGVVIFNMIRRPTALVTEDLAPRPVVKLMAPGGTGSGSGTNVGGSGTRGESPGSGRSWIDGITPAPVFGSKTGSKTGSKSEGLNQRDLKPRTLKPPTSSQQRVTQPNVTKKDPLDSWSPNAGSLEASRRSGPPVSVVSKPVMEKWQPPKQEVVKPVQKISKPPVSAFNAVKPTSTTTPIKQPPRSGYSVQLASFSSEERAQSLGQTLSGLKFDGKKLPVYHTRATVGGKTYYRVKLGPFANRDQADQANTLVQRTANMKGTVLRSGN